MKRGFTLSEVLMTLAIIGVISAVVIPGLKSGTQVKKTDAMYAKYCYILDSALSQAMVKNHVENPEDVTFAQLIENLSGSANNMFVFKDGTALAPVPDTHYLRVRYPNRMQIADRYYLIDKSKGGIDCSSNGQASIPE